MIASSRYVVTVIDQISHSQRDVPPTVVPLELGLDEGDYLSRPLT